MSNNLFDLPGKVAVVTGAASGPGLCAAPRGLSLARVARVARMARMALPPMLSPVDGAAPAHAPKGDGNG